MSKHSILVVDDELFVRELLEEYFSKLDFDVSVASSGPVALKMVAENRFKVALIDLKMSDMDGIEVLKSIRELDESLIMILMTGYPTVESSIEAMRSGAYDYVIKPFRLNELKDIITRAIKEHHFRSEIGEIKSRIEALEHKLASLTNEQDSRRTNKKSKRTTVAESDGVYSRTTVTTDSQLASDCQLERWGKLLKEGLISQQEFDANKKRILAAV